MEVSPSLQNVSLVEQNTKDTSKHSQKTSQAVAPYSAGHILQLQKALGNRAVVHLLSAQMRSKQAVQLKIGHDGTSFTTDGKRPGWRSFLKKSTADELKVSASSNFAKLGYDRAHRIPFSAIEHLLCDFCNGDATEREFTELTDAMYDGGDEEYENMNSARDTLIESIKAGATPSNIRLEANFLLGLLNSATKNVSPGDASENRGIQDRADYGYVASPGGTTFDLSPRSSDLHTAWSSWDREPELPMTPGGEHVRSSQISSEQQQSGTAVSLDQINDL